jgi:16S rRNA (guanine966-N2)-methyltransferase
MRIIGGLAKGRNLLSPVGMGTRPTLDRIKESIFNIIQNYTYGAVAVDVFAGTGSLGLEAVSRGAKECHLVDKGAETFAFLKQNVENLKFGDKCHCYNMDSYKALELFTQKNMIFNIIFIDPPYLKDMIPPAIELITKGKLLAPNGIIASKIDSSEKIYEGNEVIVLTDYRKYGNTTVCFYKYKES